MQEAKLYITCEQDPTFLQAKSNFGATLVQLVIQTWTLGISVVEGMEASEAIIIEFIKEVD